MRGKSRVALYAVAAMAGAALVVTWPGMVTLTVVTVGIAICFAVFDVVRGGR